MGNATGEQLSLLMDEPDARFRVHASHRLETLAERLAEEMRRNPAEPLEPERIVVPDALLGQWLRLQLATRLGVAAHLRVERPAEFAWGAMRELLSALPRQSVFGAPYLRWRIFDRLGDHGGDDEIARYLADGDARKRFELADRLAIAYDRCRVYRPDSIRKWQQGSAAGWHARLWADLASGQTAPRHWVDAVDSYRKALAERATKTPRWRVNVFNLATMSPTYVDMLRLAAETMDINLYLLSPSRTFWDTRPRRDERGYYEERDDLLSAWGRSARDLQVLLGRQPGGASIDQRPTAQDMPRGATCLAALQRSILDSGTGADASPDGSKPGTDDSIQVHVCHSATREVEVLHDRLLGIFATHRDIQPADVLVLTPDVDTYAPLVEAVFGSAARIPFSIGRQRLKEGAALAAFLELLELPGSRYAASDVLAPLLAASVRACFDIDESDLAAIRDAVARARIRWGIDADHCTELGVPASENHNWRRGLDRLVLGYAMHENDVLVDDIAPCALDGRGFRIGAGDYELLGRFHRYCELAFALNGWADAELTATQWTHRLREEILDGFFTRDPRMGPDIVREVNTVIQLIDEFEAECRLAEASEPIPYAVLRDVLNEHAAKAVRSAPRLAEGVTVAALASGQIFPAKVICAVGMNDGSFPRRPQPAPFDFQADLFDGQARQPGDLDVRDEDRFAFLEALLAARRCFVLTYTGRDLQEDKPIPPSVIVSELTAHLNELLPHVGRGKESDTWQTRHPLQPFSIRYFQKGEPELFSYSQPMAAASTALKASGEPPLRFMGEVATDDHRDQARELELEELIRFTSSPSKHFARHRLGLVLDTRDDQVADDEPLDLDALEAWQLKSDLATIEGRGEDRTIDLAAARGLLPPENLGRLQHQESSSQVEALLEKLQAYREHEQAEPQQIDIVLGDTRVVGAIRRFHETRNQLLWWRIGGVRPKDRIKVWLRLLALTCQLNRTATAHLFGVKQDVQTVSLTGPPPADARSLLEHWITLWQDGQRCPAPFFASTSWAWVTGKKPIEAALKEWNSGFGEGRDPCHQLIFGDDPCDDEFERHAERLLDPLKQAEAGKAKS